jgi:hypothetical protein
LSERSGGGRHKKKRSKKGCSDEHPVINHFPLKKMRRLGSALGYFFFFFLAAFFLVAILECPPSEFLLLAVLDSQDSTNSTVAYLHPRY